MRAADRKRFISILARFIIKITFLNSLISHPCAFVLFCLMRWFTAIIFLLQFLAADAQQPDIVFHHITEKEGLSYNIINCFLKDSRGILWIGTYNGLNRYDGAHFYNYYSGAAHHTIGNNTVHKLAEDKNGNIWGGTDNGVFRLDPKTGKAKNYRVASYKKGEWQAMFNILCDQQGRIWAGNFRLYLYNEKKDTFEVAPSVTGDEQIQIRKNGMLESPDGKGIWLTTRKGLQYYDINAQRYTSFKNSTDSTLFNNHSTAAICRSNFGYFLYVDHVSKTIIAFDPVSKKVKFTVHPAALDSMGYAATLFEDNSRMLWLCTWSYELVRIDPQQGNAVTSIVHNKNDVTSIAGDFFWDAMQEADGTLWFGTVGGISKCNPSRTFYKVHHLPAASHREQIPAIVFMAENSQDQTWWFVTTKNLLVHYNPVAGSSEWFDLGKFKVNSNNKMPEYVYRMIFYRDSIFLFSYTGAWIKKTNEKNFVPLKLNEPYNGWTMRDAALYNQRVLYLSSWNKLLKWDLLTGRQDSMKMVKDTLLDGKPPVLQRPSISPGGKVWMLNGYDWLTCTDNDGMKMVKLDYEAEDERGNGYFTDMKVDSRGKVWLAKKGDGVVFYDPQSGKSGHLKQRDGLVMDHVMALSEDSSGKIWLGAYNQFSVYNPLLNSFYNFTLPLSPNNYAYENLMTTLVNGNIIASIGPDVVEFFTGKIKPPQVKDKPLISMLSVNGTDTGFYDSNVLHLQPHENSLRIKFGMLTDNVVTPYDMLYILEGAEQTWTMVSVNFEASYNSLPPGDYTFKVKALAKDKSWQTAETVLKVHIATPFYKAWWFLVLVFCILLTVVWATYRLRMSQKERLLLLENKAQLLEKEKTQVMYENLKQHLNPHFLFNSLTSLSSLIRIDQKMAGNFLDKMSKVYRYILKNRDNETVALADEIKFVQLYIDLQKTRFGNGLVINMDIDEEYHHRRIAPVTLQNLVENAIKHNTADPDMPLVIQLYVEGDYFIVKNNLQKKTFVETSNRQGLGNMQSLYRFLSDREMTVTEADGYFVVKVPLI